MSQDQLQLLTRETLRKTAGAIRYWGESENNWVVLSPSELEAIIAENERRDSLRNAGEIRVDWDLYDR